MEKRAKLIPKQDRVTARTPEGAVDKSRAEILKLSDTITLKVENGETTAQIKLKVGDKEYPATIELKGLVTFSNLTDGVTVINGGNITTGKILSADGISLVIDLDKGTADLTGTLTTTGHWDESGYYRYTEVSPDGVHVWRRDRDYNTDETGITQGKVTVSEDPDRAEFSAKKIVFYDMKNGNHLQLALEDGKGRLSGLADPEEDGDAVNKAYLEEYVFRELDKLRAELGLPVG